MAPKFAKDHPTGFTNRVERVAIVGAGGQIGKHIVEALLKTGKHTVTAITRSGSTNKLPEGVKAAYINYDDESTIVTALKDQQVLIITMSVTAPPSTHTKLFRAAAHAGVSYIFPNWWGSDITNDLLAKETLWGVGCKAHCAEIERLGVSKWILLCTNCWYEFSLGGGPARYGFDFKNRRLVLYDEGTTRINTSTWPQSGRAVAAVLSLKELPDDETDTSSTISQFHNAPMRISSFRISRLDMLESVKRVTGTTDSDWSVSKEPSGKRYLDGMEEMKEGDVASGFAKLLYARVFYPNGDGDYESSKGIHNEVLGLPTEDLDEYTRIGIAMAMNDAVPD